MMRVLITGATGMIGRRLVIDRLERRDNVVIVSRNAGAAQTFFAAENNPRIEIVRGDPSIPGAWQKAVDGCTAVIHLAGANVMGQRWSQKYKQVLVNSRIDSAHQIVEAIRLAKVKPKTFVCASATGYYADTGDRETDESSAPDAGEFDFLADLVRRCETGAKKAEEFGTRTVSLRIGVVLDTRGGLIATLTRPFRFFVGGPIGLGHQFVPWIHWRDVIGLIDLALRRPDLKGPINLTSPNPVTNRDFCRAFGRALGRPSWLPVPVPALRLLLGEMGKYAAFSQRVIPANNRFRVGGNGFILR